MQIGKALIQCSDAPFGDVGDGCLIEKYGNKRCHDSDEQRTAIYITQVEPARSSCARSPRGKSREALPSRECPR